ncbi:MAG: hypothetical protein RR088_04000 [Clostridia bacterium]
MKCVNCGKEYDGYFCPYCETPNDEEKVYKDAEYTPHEPTKLFKKWWFWLVILASLIAFVLTIYTINKEQAKNSPPSTKTNVTYQQIVDFI